MSIKFLALGEGGYFVFGGGGKCRFYVYGRGDFSDNLVDPAGVVENWFTNRRLGSTLSAFPGKTAEVPEN